MPDRESPSPNRRPSHHDADGIIRTLGLLTTLGFAVVVGILSLLLAGLFLDRVFGTTPVLTIIGIFVGMFAGIGAAYSLLRKYLKDFDHGR